MGKPESLSPKPEAKHKEARDVEASLDLVPAVGENENENENENETKKGRKWQKPPLNK